MANVNDNGQFVGRKADEGKIKQRIDASEFRWVEQDGKVTLFCGVESKSQVGDAYFFNAEKVPIPGTLSITLDPAQPCQSFLASQLKEKTSPDKVYGGFVAIDDFSELYKRANEPVVAEILATSVMQLAEITDPKILKGELKVPVAFSRGGNRASYDPVAKFNAFGKITGLEGNLVEISLVVASMPESQQKAFLELLKAVL